MVNKKSIRQIAKALRIIAEKKGLYPIRYGYKESDRLGLTTYDNNTDKPKILAIIKSETTRLMATTSIRSIFTPTYASTTPTPYFIYSNFC